MQEMENLKKMADVSEELMRFLEQLLIGAAKAAHGERNKALEDMIKYMKNGGQVDNIMIPAADEQIFAEMLKDRKVSYCTIDVPTEDGKDPRTIFLFKDTDAAKLKVVLDDYKRHLDGLVNELPPVEFFQANQSKGYERVEGLSQAQLTVFRSCAEKYNFDFCVEDGASPETFVVCANSKEFLDKTLNDMLYYTSGPDGHEYIEKMTKYGADQKEFLEKARKAAEKGHEAAYVVDAKHPDRLIRIKDGGWSEHKLVIEKETVDGVEQRNGVDTWHMEHEDLDDVFINSVRRMEHPVFLQGDEAPDYVSGINDDGGLEVTDDFCDLEHLREFRREKMAAPPIAVWAPRHAKRELLRANALKTYYNLPVQIVRKLEETGIDGVYISGRDIAYTDAAAPVVQKFLAENLYQNMKYPLRAKADDIFYKGNGRGRFSNLAPDEEYYITDPGDSGEYLKFTQDGCDIGGFEKTEGEDTVIHISAADDIYEETVLRYLNRIEVPVVLTSDEFCDNKHRAEIVASKLPDPEDNKAVQLVHQMDDDEREKIGEYVLMGDEQLANETLSPTQREAVQKRRELKVEHVDESKDKLRDAKERDATARIRKEKTKETKEKSEKDMER